MTHFDAYTWYNKNKLKGKFMLDEELQVRASYDPIKNCLRMVTDKKGWEDAMVWYGINSDGSGREQDCWNEPFEYPQLTYTSVLYNAKEIYNKEKTWRKLINRIFHQGPFYFKEKDAFLLFDELENVNKGKITNGK
jgi:hypothetical protein